MSKVFLVTGSSRGLGRQVAEKALAAGHELVATARRPEQLAGLATRTWRPSRTSRTRTSASRWRRTCSAW